MKPIIIIEAPDLDPKAWRANCGECCKSFVVYKLGKTVKCPVCAYETKPIVDKL